MFAAGHLGGGSSLLKRYKIGVTIVDPGTPIITVTDPIGIRPATTTSLAACHGLGLDTDVYAATQAALLAQSADPNTAEGVITVSVRPDLIVKSLMAGSATNGVALATKTNTLTSTDGLLVTDAANFSANDMTGGVIWCIGGANVGQSRTVASDAASTSATVTVAFYNDIAVGDTFLSVPYNNIGTGGADLDGNSNIQLTTLLTQANASIAGGTGGDVSVVELELNGASDSFVLFIFDDHLFGSGSSL